MSSLLPHLILAVDPNEDGTSIFKIIFWVGVMIFWVIGQIAQKKKDQEALKRQAKPQQVQRPQQAQSPAPRPVQSDRPSPSTSTSTPASTGSRSDIEDDMRKFLEQLTGNAQQAAPKPTPKPAPPPMPVRPQPTIQFDEEPVVRTVVKKGKKADQSETDRLHDIDESIYDLDDSAVYKEADAIIDMAELERQIEGEHLHAAQTLVNVRTFIIDFDTLTVPIMRTDILSMRPVRTKTSHPKLSQKKALRQAVVSRIILSPCKALSDDIFHTDQGAL
jgi:hypothetical protein